jgi:hypothetical protein
MKLKKPAFLHSNAKWELTLLLMTYHSQNWFSYWKYNFDSLSQMMEETPSSMCKTAYWIIKFKTLSFLMLLIQTVDLPCLGKQYLTLEGRNACCSHSLHSIRTDKWNIFFFIVFLQFLIQAFTLQLRNTRLWHNFIYQSLNATESATTLANTPKISNFSTYFQ